MTAKALGTRLMTAKKNGQQALLAIVNTQVAFETLPSKEAESFWFSWSQQYMVLVEEDKID